MNTSTISEPVYEPVYKQAYKPTAIESQQQAVYLHWWKGAYDSCDSYGIPISMQYNTVSMEFENLLNNLFKTKAADNYLRSTEDILPDHNSVKGIQSCQWTDKAKEDYDALSEICHPEQLSQLKTVLNVFFSNLSSDLYDLIVKIPLDIDLNEDDFISVDWTFKNLSIGFTLESDPKFSGWWTSSNEKAGNLLLAGLMPDDGKIDEKVKFCLQTVLDNFKGLMA